METLNIQDTFEYAAENAKKDFQAEIASMLEFHLQLQDRLIKSRQRKKEGVWISNEELIILTRWTLDLAGNLMGHYLSIDRVNRNANKLFKSALKIQEQARKTPSLKRLLE
jgi:hypothetical protein